MKKRMLAGLMALILVLSLLPVGVVAEEVSLEKTTTHTDHSGWTAWEKGSELPTTEGNYYLTADVALTTTARIVTAQAVTICLSGHKIEGPTSGGGVFRLENGAVVTICDCTAHTDENGNYVAGQLLPRCSAAGGIASLGGDTGATFILQDGIIDGAGRSYSNDGAVVVVNKKGTFRMEGGQIKNFAITNCGIIRVWQGSFYLSGGQIFDNSSTGTVDGIAVRVDSGSAMYMSGGLITNNTSKTAAGAAVNVASGGTLELSGGKITRNAAPNGAAIIVNGTLRMTGGAICDNNSTANGAGMYINPNGTAIISGGSICCNTAPNGAGIYCSGKLTVSGDVSISENIAAGKGGGLCAEKAATVTLSGGSFTKNTAATGGGVYYGSTGTMTLGGSTVITGNTAEKAKSNLYLADGKYFQLDGTALPLTQGAAVGISLSKVPTSTVVLATGAPQADATEYFTMDAPVDGFELRCGSSLRYGKARQLQHPVEGYDKAGHADDWSEWNNTNALPAQSGKYYLTGDVALTGETNLNADVDITLCLNGYSILAASGKRAFKLSGNAKLTLCDCTSHYDEDGSFMAGSVSGGAGTALVEGGTLTIYDILMTGGVGSQAGALQITGGKVEIYGSELSGNRCTAGSGGGAICITGGSLLLQDTRVTGNFAAEAGASAIFSNGNVALTLRDSVITNNMHTASSVTWRGAVYILKGTVKCTVSGSTVIDDNYLANGKTEGNLFFQNADARVTVDNLTEGASIGVLTQTAVTESKSLVFSENVEQADAAGYFTSDRGHAVTLQEGCLVVGVRKHVDHTTDQCGHENVTWQAWNGQLTTPGHYYLTQDLTLTKHLEFNTAGEFTLCLNGYSVYCPQGDRAFKLLNGAKLNLCDCNASTDAEGNYTAGKITGGSTAEGAAVFVYHKDSRFTMYDGLITGNASEGDKSKGIVLVVEGQFVMRGGQIRDNAAKHGMVWLNSAASDFRLEGGKITENTIASIDSGALHMHNGTATMTDGEISDHTVKGVFMNQNAQFTLAGGKITRNTSQRDGAGVRVDTDKAVFTMTGGEISDNTATGGAGGIMTKGTVYISGGQIRGNQAVNGAGVVASGGSTVQISGGSICENIAQDSAGGLYTQAGSVVQISGGAICHNKTENNAAGVCMAGGTLEMTGGRIEANEAPNTGAGVYVFGKSVFTLKDGEICDNTSGNEGAGVYVNDGTFEMLGGAIRSNATAVSGGGVCVRGENGKFILRGGAVKDNRALTEKLGNAAGVLAQGKGTLLMYGGEVTGNSAAVNGGGVQNYFSTAHLYGGTISNNTAGNEGGGVFSAGGNLTLEGADITGNRAKAAGGMVIAQAGTAKITAGKIRKSSAQNDGGGLVVQGKSSVTMTGGEISGNTVPKTGAGVYVAKDSTLLLQSGNISNNIAQGEGAGVYINSGKLVMTGGSVSGNITDSNGAGIVVRGEGAILELRGGEIRGNQAMNPEKGHGGGVLIQSHGKMKMSGGKVNKNQVAGNGAGIYNSMTPLVITGGVICENSTVGEGAGMYLNGGTTTLDGGSVENNETTKGNGGGICARGGAQLIMKSGKVAGNKSAAHAGGILLQSGAKLVMHGGEVTENEAVISGGGIRSAGCEVEIYGGRVSKNISGELGGGIYAEKSLIVKNCEISENQIVTANGGAGAGIRLGTGAVAHLENVVFHANSAIGRGGAFDTAYSCTSTLVNCTFTENFTTSNGAAIDSGIVGTMTLKNCVFRDNKTDGYGGVFYGEANGKYLFEDCVMENNSAAMGGAMYVKASGRTDLVRTSITGNTASIMASAVYSSSGVFFTDSTVTGNTDQGGNSAVYLTNEDTDHESYMPCVNQLRGTVQIADNQGGDLVLGEYTAVNVHGDGLGAESKILLQLPQGGIQRFVTGPYNFSRQGDMYTLTAGEGSLTDIDPVTEPEQELPEQNTEQPTEPEQPQEKENSGVAVIAAVAAGVLLVLAAVVLLIVRKSKKH